MKAQEILNKSIKKILIPLVVSMTIGYVAFSTIGYILLKKHHSSIIDNATFAEKGLQIKIYDKFRINFFPIIHISSNDATILHNGVNLNHGNVSIYFSARSIITQSDTIISSIHVSDGDLTLNHDNSILTAASNSDDLIPCTNFTMRNIALLDRSSGKSISKLKLTCNHGNKRELSGELRYDKKTITFHYSHATAGKAQTSTAQVGYNNSFLTAEWQTKDSQIKGEVKLTLDPISDLFKIIRNHNSTSNGSHGNNIITTNGDTYYMSKHKDDVQQERSGIFNKQIMIKGDIFADNNIISLRRITTSPQIAKEIDYILDIHLDRAIPEIYSILSLDGINLNHFTHTAANNEDNSNDFLTNIITQHIPAYIQSGGIRAPNIKASGIFDIRMSNVKYMNRDDITINLESNLLPDSIQVNDFSISSSEDDYIRINGKSDASGTLRGTLSITNRNSKLLRSLIQSDTEHHNEFLLLYADLVYMPHHLQILNSNFALNENSLFSGTLLMDYLDKRNIYYNMHLIGNEVNLDELGVGNAFDNYTQALFSDQTKQKRPKGANNNVDAANEDYYDLITEHGWLRELHGHKNITLNCNKLTFKNEQFNNLYIVSKLSANNIEMHHLSLQSDPLNVSGEFKLTLPLLYPHFTSKLNIRSIDLKKVRDIFFTNVPKDLEDIHISPHYLLDADLNIASLSWNKFSLNDVVSSLTLRNKALTIKKTKFGIFNGMGTLRGDVSFGKASPLFTIKFKLLNFDSKSFLSSIANFSNLEGYMSVDGAISNREDKISKDHSIHAFGKVVCNKTKYHGFDLVNIIDAVDDTDAELDNRAQRIKYYSNYGTTFFSNLTGDITLKNGILSCKDITASNKRVNGSINMQYIVQDDHLDTIAHYAFIPSSTNSTVNMMFASSGTPSQRKQQTDISEVLSYIGYEDDQDDVDEVEGTHLRNRIVNTYKKKATEQDAK